MIEKFLMLVGFKKNEFISSDLRGPQMREMDSIFLQFIETQPLDITNATKFLQNGYIPSDSIYQTFSNLFCSLGMDGFTTERFIRQLELTNSREKIAEFFKSFLDGVASGVEKNYHYHSYHMLMPGHISCDFLTFNKWQQSNSTSSTTDQNTAQMIAELKRYDNFKEHLRTHNYPKILFAIQEVAQRQAGVIKSQIDQGLEVCNQQLKKNNFARVSLNQISFSDQENDNKVVRACSSISSKIDTIKSLYKDVLSTEQQVFLTNLVNKDLAMLSTNALTVLPQVKKNYFDKTNVELEDSLIEVSQTIMVSVEQIEADCVQKMGDSLHNQVSQSKVYLNQKINDARSQANQAQANKSVMSAKA